MGAVLGSYHGPPGGDHLIAVIRCTGPRRCHLSHKLSSNYSFKE